MVENIQVEGAKLREFRYGEITPDATLLENGWIIGAVVFVRDKQADKLLLLKSAVDKPETGNGTGDWQCVCETSENGEYPVSTAERGIAEELDPETLQKIDCLAYLGEGIFLNESNRNVMARVFLADWVGEENFTDFSCPSEEASEFGWFSPGSIRQNSLREGVVNVLNGIGNGLAPEESQWKILSW
jgi:hypothetical protein